MPSIDDEPLILDTFPKLRRDRGNHLRVHQVKVLKVLSDSGGYLTRSKIAERSHISYGRVVQALSPRKDSRYPSLLELELVEEVALDIDGLQEITFTLTLKGQEAFRSLPPTTLATIAEKPDNDDSDTED